MTEGMITITAQITVPGRVNVRVTGYLDFGFGAQNIQVSGNTLSLKVQPGKKDQALKWLRERDYLTNVTASQ